MMRSSILLLLLAVAATTTITSAFAPYSHSSFSFAGMETSSRLFGGLKEELEGEPDDASKTLADEFYELERGHGLTEQDLKDLENDDFDGDNLVVRSEIDKDGNKIVDYEFSEDEDYSSNRSVDD